MMLAVFVAGDALLSSLIAVVVIILIWAWQSYLLPSTSDLKGKWVLITGCDTGIGKMAAIGLIRKYSSRGLNVICLCLTEEGAANALALGAIGAFACDVTDYSRMTQEILPKVIELCDGKLWAVVHVAGIMNYGSTEYLLVDDYKRVMDVNFFSIVHMNQYLFPYLKQGKGRIIMISSVSGLFSFPFIAPYCAAKHALDGHSKSLRYEAHKAGIRVIIINPGTVKSDLTVNFFDNFQSLHSKRYQENPTATCFQEMNLQWAQDHVRDYEPGFKMTWEDPICVVNDIVHAVTATNPQHRYLSGIAAKTAFRMLWTIPEMWTHHLMYLAFYKTWPRRL